MGTEVGFFVTPFTEGLEVVGYLDGKPVGTLVGLLVVGRWVGIVDGWQEGCLDGVVVG